jgi:hypothetical protein
VKVEENPGPGSNTYERGEMISKCSNSECEAPFNYREGRLVRVSRTPLNDQAAANQRVIEHFWLCGKCAAVYVLAYESGENAALKLRHQESSRQSVAEFVCVG